MKVYNLPLNKMDQPMSERVSGDTCLSNLNYSMSLLFFVAATYQFILVKSDAKRKYGRAYLIKNA